MKLVKTTLLVTLVAILVAGAAVANDTPTTAATATPAPADRHFDAEAATAAYMAQMSPEARAKSDAYFEGGYWLILWDLIAGLVVAWLFLGTGLSARMRDWVERVTRSRWLQTALYSLQYIIIATVVLLPWSAYEGYFREHQYGMSNQTLGGWLGDQAKGLAIGLILGTLAITAVYAVLRKAPHTWWMWGSLVMIVFSIFAAAITRPQSSVSRTSRACIASGPLAAGSTAIGSRRSRISGSAITRLTSACSRSTIGRGRLAGPAMPFQVTMV